MNIRFSIRGLKEVKEFMASLPRGVKIVAMRAFSTYIIGDERHGLKHEPAQVTHGPGNPFKWTSDRQRRAFFATDGFGGGIPTTRTHEGVNSWTMTEKDSNWSSVKIEGGNQFVQGDWQQRGHKADGWKTYVEVLASNMAGALRSAISAVDAWLKSKNK